MIAAATENIHPAVRAALPAAIELRSVPRDGTGLDGVGFLVGGWITRALMDAVAELPELQVLQTLSAGTDHIEPFLPPQATLCNATGARDVPVAEWVVGAILGAATGLLEATRHTAWRDGVRPGEVAGSTVLIVGHGSIGRAVEARLAPLGARVVGVTSRTVAELDTLLPEADVLVILTPLTEATRGMVDARRLALLPDGALVVNAGRGAVVDTHALVAETSGRARLRAVLDVVDPEPLPAGHPLWSAPGVLAITPHHAGDSARAEERAAALAADQVVRWTRGEPLLNVARAGAR